VASKRRVPCRHFAFGEGVCPFGSSCFYAHVDRLGRPVDVAGPRIAAGAAGAAPLPSYRLSDYLFPDGGAPGALDPLEAQPRAVD
jgi:E3 ubiquitin-protein ligase makorin